MNLRIEQYDDGEVVYLALEPNGTWAHSEFPADTITVDFDADDRVIGVEVVGASSPTMIEDLVGVLVPASERDEVLSTLTGSAA